MTRAPESSQFSGTLAERGDGRIVLTLPHSDYRLHLAADTSSGALANAALGRPISGRIHANARRVDVVGTGGRYIEPTYGRPRRLQGTIIAVDPAANTITVHCGCPFICTLMDRQNAGDFLPGQLVTFDVERGARFEAV